MLQILNKTPFASGIGLFTEPDGTERVTAVLKATFVLPDDGQVCMPSSEQLPVQECDSYFGEPGRSSLKYPVDLVLEKAATDIGIVGHVHSPEGRLVTQLTAEVAVGGLRKRVLVTGDRTWCKRTFLPGMVMSDAAPFVVMPLRYERSFGGQDPIAKEQAKAFEPSNLIGRGYFLSERAADNGSLPNFEDPGQLISSWRDKPKVSGLGFIDAAWHPRAEFAGTYDDAWRKYRFPLLPEDFDSRFFNCAAGGLVATGHLQGDEPVELVNLARRSVVRFRLPALRLRMAFRLGDTLHDRAPALFTVVFEPDEDRFYLVFGASFPVGKQPSRLRYVKIEYDESGPQWN